MRLTIAAIMAAGLVLCGGCDFSDIFGSDDKSIHINGNENNVAVGDGSGEAGDDEETTTDTKE